MTWQPIATAPKEGCFLISDGAMVVYAAREKGDYWDIAGYKWPAPPPDEKLGMSHWMPLPDPPTSDESITTALPHSDWHIIRSIGVENRGEDIPIDQVGKVREFIPGIREMVLTIVGEFPAKNIDVVEVNGIRFKREAEKFV